MLCMCVCVCLFQEVKLQRDQLVEENQTLAEANRRYRLHTTELKEKVESLAVHQLTQIGHTHMHTCTHMHARTHTHTH